MLAIRIITFFFSFLYLESMLHISFWRITTKKKQVCKINGADFRFETVMSHYSLLSIIGISMTKAAWTQTLNHQKIEKSERDLIKWHYSIHTRMFGRQGVCRLLWWVYHDLDNAKKCILFQKCILSMEFMLQLLFWK